MQAKATYAKLRITSIEQVGYYYGRKCDEHFVYQVNAEKDGVAYECNLPIVLQDGKEWEFYENDQRVTRNVTEADQLEMLKHVGSYFPDYGEIKLNGDCIDDFIKWMASGDVYVNGKIEDDYTDKDGEVHHRFKVCKPGVTFDNSWLASLGKANKTLKKADTTPSNDAVPPPPPTTPHKSSGLVRPSSVVYKREDAWKAYATYHKTEDPEGVLYWRRVQEVTGKDPGHLEEFTSDDWLKCVQEFEQF